MFSVSLFTPGHKPVVFFGFHGHFHFFVKSLLFVQIYQFFPVKAECSYFSNFIMCRPVRAHVGANFTLNLGNLLEISKSNDFQKIRFWRALVLEARALSHFKSMNPQLSLEKNY